MYIPTDLAVPCEVRCTSGTMDGEFEVPFCYVVHIHFLSSAQANGFVCTPQPDGSPTFINIYCTRVANYGSSPWLSSPISKA